ncbi:MAG: c-type cytochrome [Pseudomonadales bacterium]|nr:c-type cytochrome [Pseudomonadales bacterium]
MRISVSLYITLFALLFATTNASAAVALTTPELDEIEYPEDEPPTIEEINLGKTLFFDKRLSANQTQSCATCHNPDLGFGDGMAKGIGSEGNSLSRNTPHIYNLAWAAVFFWDGRSASLEDQALGPIQAEGEMNMPIEDLLPRLQQVPFYQQQFKAIYGSATIGADEIARAIAAFERSIVSSNSAFDRYIAGNKAAMGPASIRGMQLFEGKAKCTQCHDGANFTDDSFHNIGLGIEDEGRQKITHNKRMAGAFKTPGLRNSSLTAPYFHDGSVTTLEEVIRFYNKGGNTHQNKDQLIQPLNLTDQEIMDLVAFLGALTSEVTVDRPTIP